MRNIQGENERPYLTPPAIARLLRVSPDKVLGWIRRGELRAVDVSDSLRPRYPVSPDDLDAFLEGMILFY
jgi:excisionase family DNA binding protein